MATVDERIAELEALIAELQAKVEALKTEGDQFSKFYEFAKENGVDLSGLNIDQLANIIAAWQKFTVK